MQLVLDDQFRRWQPPSSEHRSNARLARTIESIAIVSIYSSEERTYGPSPGHGCELVHRCDYETRQPPVQRLIHGYDRQESPAAEIASSIHTSHHQIRRIISIRSAARNQPERLALEFLAAPRALFEWN